MALIFAPAVAGGFLLSALVNRYLDRRRVYLVSVLVSLIGALAMVLEASGVWSVGASTGV